MLPGYTYMDMIFLTLSRNKLIRSLAAALLCTVFLQPLTLYAERNANIAVIYPDVREPYLSIFKEIKAGIDQSLENPAKTILLEDGSTAPNLETLLENSDIDSVITLGTGAYRYASKISVNRTVISAAIFTRPSDNHTNVPSISMIVSPESQLSQLAKIAPRVKTVHVVYNPEEDGWLIELARSSLKNIDIHLQAIACYGLKDSAAAYQELIESQKLGNSDALWLLQGDKAIRESAMLSRILQQAWDNSFVVFSANPSHVKRGALFATYPDNEKLGKRLGSTIIESGYDGIKGIHPLSDIKIAFNARTAEHLKLNITRSKKKTFDLIFPNR
jgi:putative ABC transport system substrate-binding protein